MTYKFNGPKELNPKHRAAAEEYVISGNKLEALVKAGYTHSYAKARGYKIYDSEPMKAYIEELLEKAQNAKIADIREVLEILTSAARGELDEEMVVVEGCGEGMSQAVKVSRTIAPKDRLKAAELLGRKYGAFTDKVKHEGAVPVVLKDDVDD